ncbi:MAG: aminotransferase class I/II-fold pyridoxal phosphate-dependent enzyme [Clostridia bacterium]|jgi:lysine decarboxylase|nr:aminotransferase class I/II-fold pyridoxal phosphate-dependent enzyme [Clostridia bacterium]
MSAPLYDKLLKHRRENIYPFHMPGHKMGRGIPEWDIFSMDITEINGFDNLMNPKDVIKEAEEKMAALYGAEKSFFSVNGSSGSLIAAVTAVCREGEKIIAARNCHKSVYSAFIFSGAVPIYVYPEQIPNTDITGGIDAEKIKKAIYENPDAKAVIITSPTAEGICSDVEKIAEFAHDNGMLLIVDEAHGAHFPFSDILPKSALEQGADIVVQSMHKTLDAPTQTSVLHIGTKHVDSQRIMKTLSMIQTSSPSYIFMSVMDKCRDELEKNGRKRYKIFMDKIRLYRQKFNFKNMQLLDEKYIGKYGIKDIDISKLTVISKNIKGTEIASKLEERKIVLEMSCPGHFTAICTPSDDDEGFIRLKKALFEIDSEIKKNGSADLCMPYPKMEMIYKPRDAFYMNESEINFEKSAGFVSAEFVIPYPPGIPVIVPGEKISRKAIDIIKNYAESGVEIVGCTHQRLEKIRILS